MECAQHTIHPASTEQEATDIAVRLTDRERPCDEAGVHVVVRVSDGGNTAYARVRDEASTGDLSQRWLQHARRGSSPGGWSEAHHPRSEQDVEAWKAAHATTLDRLLIDRSKHAWRLEAEAPYVVEYAPATLTDCGIDTGD